MNYLKTSTVIIIYTITLISSHLYADSDYIFLDNATQYNPETGIKLEQSPDANQYYRINNEVQVEVYPSKKLKSNEKDLKSSVDKPQNSSKVKSAFGFTFEDMSKKTTKSDEKSSATSENSTTKKSSFGFSFSEMAKMTHKAESGKTPTPNKEIKKSAPK
jgi:hypothetical protein